MSLKETTPEIMGRQWYFVHVHTGKEDNVIQHLQKRIASTKEMGSKFGQMIVPTEEVVEMRGGQKRKSLRKFYPGYVLMHMEMSDETWHFVKGVPGVLGFVGGQNPSPIPEKEVQSILGLLKKGEKPKPKISYQSGEMVRVIDGPFANFNGVVEEVKHEKGKVRVLVSIFGRSTPVELDFLQVEKN